MPNASQNMNPPDRDSFIMNPNLNMSLSSTIQSSSLLTGKSPTTIGKFQGTGNARKGTLDGNMPVLTPTSVALGDMNERRAQFSAYLPLNALDKAQSLTSLLEQSAINKGNLETTYTGSIPNLDLLGDERQSSLASCDALDTATSFTSLLEQFAITYTGSIPKLDLLGEILGQ